MENTEKKYPKIMHTTYVIKIPFNTSTSGFLYQNEAYQTPGKMLESLVLIQDNGANGVHQFIIQ